jgi:rhodanese-related sulfurtransferase
MNILSVSQLQQRLADHSITLLDVREAEELAIAAIHPAVHIPLQQLPSRLAELDPQAPIAVLCHHGMRSEMAARLLISKGFAEVANVAGGIDAWSLQIDSSVGRY